jgi:hypothetical protein
VPTQFRKLVARQQHSGVTCCQLTLSLLHEKSLPPTIFLLAGQRLSSSAWSRS